MTRFDYELVFDEIEPIMRALVGLHKKEAINAKVYSNIKMLVLHHFHTQIHTN